MKLEFEINDESLKRLTRITTIANIEVADLIAKGIVLLEYIQSTQLKGFTETQIKSSNPYNRAIIIRDFPLKLVK